jgi:hypothetical protein
VGTAVQFRRIKKKTIWGKAAHHVSLMRQVDLAIASFPRYSVYLPQETVFPPKPRMP